MLTPMFGIKDIRALRATPDTNPDEIRQLRDKSLLISATELAIESAIKFGLDMPVGAVTASGDMINGRYFASDKRNGYRQMHAEYMAVLDARLDIVAPQPDTVVVTMEPCDNCQDFLARVPSIRRVGFGITRQEVAERGLVKPHGETIFDRARRLHLPYEVVLIDDPLLQQVGRTILDAVKRDPVQETLQVDAEQLRQALGELRKT